MKKNKTIKVLSCLSPILLLLLMFQNCNKIKVSDISPDSSTASFGANEVPGTSEIPVDNSVPVINTRVCTNHVEEVGLYSGKDAYRISEPKIAIMAGPAGVKLDARDSKIKKLAQSLVNGDTTINVKIRETGTFKSGHKSFKDMQLPLINLNGISQSDIESRIAALGKDEELKIVCYGKDGAGNFATFCSGQYKVDRKTKAVTAAVNTKLYSEMNSGCHEDEGEVCDTSCQKTDDPLIIDLAGTGFSFTDVSHGPLFDMDGSGIRERVAWTQKNSNNGFLFIDHNGSGRVEDGSDLFSNVMLLSNNFYPENGFEALADLDSSNDNLIDARDIAFSSIKIWIDSNGDGLTVPSEVISLSSVVDYIDLTPKKIGKTDVHGNLIYGTLNVKFKGQSVLSPRIADVWFQSRGK